VLKAECAERSTYSIPANPARGKEVKTKSRLVEINCRKTGLEVTCLTHLARSHYRPLKVRQLSSNLLAGKPRQNNDTSIERFPNECQGFSRSDTGDRCSTAHSHDKQGALGACCAESAALHMVIVPESAERLGPS
jgi:hypothetical protein